MIQRPDERLGDAFDVAAQLRRDLQARPAPVLAFDLGTVKQRGLRRRRRSQLLPAVVLAVVILGAGGVAVGTGGLTSADRGGVVTFTPADTEVQAAAAVAAQQVVRSSIELNEQGRNVEAAERFWYPGYANVSEFSLEKLQITDLVIGAPKAHSMNGLTGRWEQAVAVPVAWTRLEATGAAAAGPWSGSYVLVRHTNTDPWRITSIEASPGAGPVSVHVDLYHCGIEPLVVDGETWEVPQPPFDATNAPTSFTGHGSVVRDGDVLHYTDEAKATLTFVPDDGVPRPGCA